MFKKNKNIKKLKSEGICCIAVPKWGENALLQITDYL